MVCDVYPKRRPSIFHPLLTGSTIFPSYNSLHISDQIDLWTFNSTGCPCPPSTADQVDTTAAGEPVLAALAMAALVSSQVKPLQETTEDAANVDSRDSVITVSYSFSDRLKISIPESFLYFLLSMEKSVVRRIRQFSQNNR